MSAPFYEVNGVNFIPFLIERGITWSEEDIDAENSGRTMDGVMHRGLVARKDKHTLSFLELSVEDSRTVLGALDSQYLTVRTNVHPKLAGIATFTMYNSSRKGAVSYLDEEGEMSWQLDDLALIER